MAEACKRLIKNCIICWNYLYLSQKLAEIDEPAKRGELLQAMTQYQFDVGRRDNVLAVANREHKRFATAMER